MLSNHIIKALSERYKNIPPLIFMRSVERAKDDADLFDILESFPNEYPVVWSEKKHSWTISESLYLEESFHEE